MGVLVGVVGHVEWVTFARVARLPRAGEIVHATDWWDEAAGGGAVAAVQAAKLAGAAIFLTALGGDENGARSASQLDGQGVELHAAGRAEPQRRALTFTDADGERTISILGDRQVPLGADDAAVGAPGRCRRRVLHRRRRRGAAGGARRPGAGRDAPRP